LNQFFTFFFYSSFSSFTLLILINIIIMNDDHNNNRNNNNKIHHLQNLEQTQKTHGGVDYVWQLEIRDLKNHEKRSHFFLLSLPKQVKKCL